MSRRAAKTDDNHAQVREDLREALGDDYVYDCSHFGGGFPDLLVYVKSLDRIFLVEVKDPAKPPSARKLTDRQQWFVERFPVLVVLTAAEALQRMGLEVAA